MPDVYRTLRGRAVRGLISLFRSRPYFSSSRAGERIRESPLRMTDSFTRAPIRTPRGDFQCTCARVGLLLNAATIVTLAAVAGPVPRTTQHLDAGESVKMVYFGESITGLKISTHLVATTSGRRPLLQRED